MNKDIYPAMEGLYRRARALRREERLLRLIRREASLEEGDFEIPSSEGEELLDHLDDVVSRKKIAVNTRTFAFQPKKSGVFFPVLVNVIALAAVVAGILLFAYLSRARERSIVSEAGTFLTTEGRLIQKLRQESEEKLQQKDSEIAETRQRLAAIDAERLELQNEMDSRIQERESELREQLESELALERQRLQAGGRSEAEINEQLRLLEIERTAEYEAQLAAFAETAREEAAAREAEILELQSAYEEELEQRQREQQAIRTELEEELARREEELTEAQSTIQDDLNRLQRQRQGEQLVLDQIQGFYEQVNLDLTNGNYDGALAKLSSLRQYISQDSVASLPFMRSRKNVELFIIDSITKLIETEQAEPVRETAETAEAAAQLASVSELIEQADTFYQSGDVDSAARLYVDALNEIPMIRSGYEQLQAIRELSLDRESEELSRLISRGNRLFDQQDYAGALDAYDQALASLKADSAALNNLIDRISEAGYYTLAPDDGERDLQQVEELENFIQTMEVELAQAREETAQLQGELSAVREEKAQLEAELSAARDEAAALDSELSAAWEDSAAMDSELIAAREQIAEQERRLAAAMEDNRLLRNERQEQIDRIGSIKARYDRFLTSQEQGAERSQEELFALLQTKLLLKQVLNSESVRSEYPELYDAVENYLVTFGEDRQREGEYEAMRDIIAFIDILSNPDAAPEDAWYEGSSDTKKALYSELLEKLKKFLE